MGNGSRRLCPTCGGGGPFIVLEDDVDRGVTLCLDRDACVNRNTSSDFQRAARLLSRMAHEKRAKKIELGLTITDPDWSSLNDQAAALEEAGVAVMKMARE